MGKRCKPGNQNNIGQFETLQDCRDSGCGPNFINKDQKYNPSSVQAKKIDTDLEREPTDIDKLQRRAGIKK